MTALCKHKTKTFANKLRGSVMFSFIKFTRPLGCFFLYEKLKFLSHCGDQIWNSEFWHTLLAHFEAALKRIYIFENSYPRELTDVRILISQKITFVLQFGDQNWYPEIWNTLLTLFETFWNVKISVRESSLRFRMLWYLRNKNF